MRRRLILQETGFPRLTFITFYFIKVRVFFRIFTFYILFDEYACINPGVVNRTFANRTSIVRLTSIGFRDRR